MDPPPEAAPGEALPSSISLPRPAAPGGVLASASASCLPVFPLRSSPSPYLSSVHIYGPDSGNSRQERLCLVTASHRSDSGSPARIPGTRWRGRALPGGRRGRSSPGPHCGPPSGSHTSSHPDSDEGGLPGRPADWPTGAEHRDLVRPPGILSLLPALTLHPCPSLPAGTVLPAEGQSGVQGGLGTSKEAGLAGGL